jgi:hypothetical protein
MIAFSLLLANRPRLGWSWLLPNIGEGAGRHALGYAQGILVRWAGVSASGDRGFI